MATSVAGMELPSRRTWLAGLAVAIGALVYTTGPLYRVRTWWGFDDPLAADVTVLAVQLLVGGAAIVALATGGRWRRVDRRLGVVAIALVAWMALGALWSAGASTTLRESIMVGVTLAAGMGAAAAVGERTLVIGSWVGVQAGLGWSAILIATVQPGSQDMNGEWTGVYFNPNSLALVAAVGIFLSLVAALQLARHQLAVDGVRGPGCRRRRRPLADQRYRCPDAAVRPGRRSGRGRGWRSWAADSSVRKVDTRSIRAWCRQWSAPGSSQRRRSLWVTRGSWLSAVGRTSNLTGRTDMWDVALDWFGKQPIVGQGYLGAWFDPDFAAAQLAARGEVLGTTHNSFIELLLGAGVVGFGLAIALFSLAWVACGRRALSGRTLLAAWPLAALVFVIVENLAETLWVGGQLTVAMMGAIIVVSTSPEPTDEPTDALPDGSNLDVADVVGVERGS